ncbi:Hypothetical protein Tpal_481 [Trichococcus palustris]|uniref:Uncharacterized protein n=1 Tax=Trichococcus palustris TaxID=140314 RepID=A0A143Y8R8_9LACT|nr:hypothetical protein [Trichococcus palustris]CZQ83734.1 Hypothetical protein Tpal_481 [Trichococcus palustris]SFK70477.1 hypothetical protein SAMN04488076_103191 [Trichococcus palustris]
MNEQLSLLQDAPTVQIDETHWEIFNDQKRVGFFESDGTRYEYTSCVGAWCGSSGPLDSEKEIKFYLESAAAFLIAHDRYEEMKKWSRKVRK